MSLASIFVTCAQNASETIASVHALPKAMPQPCSSRKPTSVGMLVARLYPKNATASTVVAKITMYLRLYVSMIGADKKRKKMDEKANTLINAPISAADAPMESA